MFFSSPLSLSVPFGLNSLILAQRRVSPVQCSVLGLRSAPDSDSGPGCVSGPVQSGSDASELVPEAGRQDALHLLHDEVQRSEQRAEELQGDKVKEGFR